MNQGDRYRRRNRFDRRAEGRARRWIPVALVAALLALLLWFPLRDQQDGSPSSDSVLRSMTKQVAKENVETPEGADVTGVSGAATRDDPSREAMSSSGGAAFGDAEASSEMVLDETPDVVVINSSVEEMNSHGVDEDPTDEPSQMAARAAAAFGAMWGIEAPSRSLPVTAKRPITGCIFEAKDRGSRFRLVVVAPGDVDAFVKLKDPVSTETVLSFYVRSGDTVEAYVSEGVWEFSYALGLGSEWLGLEEKFGEKGTYWKSDRELDFTNPKLLACTYTLGSDGNVNPIAIPRTEFI